MRPASSSPSSGLAKESSALRHHDKNVKANVDAGDEEEDLMASQPPIETAYDHPKRRRATFGSASPKDSNRNNNEENSKVADSNKDEEEDDPLFPEANLETISNDAPKSRRAWDLDEEEDEDPNNACRLESQESNVSQQDLNDGTDDDKSVDMNNNEEKQKNDDNDKNDISGSDKPTEDKNKSEIDVEEGSEKTKQDDKATEKTEGTPNEEPDSDDLIASVDNLFNEADKNTVTVRDITNALEAEYNVTFSKPTKKIIRARLVDLISGRAKPSVGGGQDTEAESSPSESELSGDEETSDEEEEEEEPSSEYEDEEESKPVRRRPNKLKDGDIKSSKDKKEHSKSRRKSTRKINKKKTASIHKHAEKLRQKRMQELRVRNEELQLQQSEEDRKRAESIAAKFETNTDELRWQRLEDRLDLLQKLDQKRMQVIEVEDILDEEEIAVKKEVDPKKKVEETEFEEESDSDDDMELEIVGVKDTKKPLFSPHARTKSSALAVLDFADKASPMAKNPNKRRDFLANLRKTNQHQLSPARSGNARTMLKNTLLKKQRKMGNMWLARELGYKNEKEHLRDCIAEEKKKRQLVLQRETERLAANERTQLRERLRQEEAEEEADAPEIPEKLDTTNNAEEEEDEEMALAKEMEQDKVDEATSTDAPSTGTQQDTESSNEDADEAKDNVSKDKRALASQLLTESTDELKSVDPPKKPDQTGRSTHDCLDANGDFSKKSEENDTSTSAQKGIDGNINFGETHEYEESSQDFDIPDSQPDELSPELGLGVGNPDSSDKSTCLNSKPQLSIVKEGNNDDEKAETQQFDTQAPVASTNPFQDENQKGNLEANSKPAVADANPAANDGIVDTDDEEEFDAAEEADASKTSGKVKKDKSAGWKAMLEAEAQKLKKKRKNNEFLETEADEEEEEEVAGLEDFGFSVKKKKDKDDDDDDDDDEINAEDLKGVVDDISDDEGDEEEGDKMRRVMAAKEEKEKHKEMMRRMREGYDGRRGGIAGGGVGARGMHRFDQLVAADNREAAKQLGLLNDDELDSDDESGDKKDADAEEEDEAALLDKMLKDRFLHRSSIDLEEKFSDDEDEDEANTGDETKDKDVDEEKEQENLAKRFAKRARMQRLMDEYGHEEEFSHSLLIEEDATMKEELSQMKNGLARKRSISSASRTSSGDTASNNASDNDRGAKKQKTTSAFFNSSFKATGSLSLALQCSRKHGKTRTSFLGNSQSSSVFASQGSGVSSQKSISFSHVVFSCDSQLSRGDCQSNYLPQPSFSLPNKKVGSRKPSLASKGPSLWSRVTVASGVQKRSR